ncbi:MAG: hypothetical protein Q9166_000652 [cf. Caloplaca sp. 2 TL-2023]
MVGFTALLQPRFTVAAALAFLISILLLSRGSLFPLREGHSIKHASNRLSLSELENTFNVGSNDDVRDIAVRIGGHDNTVYNTSLSLLKREKVLNYAYAVCKGAVLWADVQRAFNGQHPPGQQFSHKDFKDSWTLSSWAGQLPNGGRWEDAFRSFAPAYAPNSIPPANSIKYLLSAQDKMFRNTAGRKVVTPTKASYNIIYVPAWKAMLATFVQSPSARLADEDDTPYDHAVPARDIPILIPPLHRLSDVSWYLWSNITVNPGLLRYIGHDYANNKHTASIIEYLIIARFGDPRHVLRWPGLVFDVESEGGKALLATPNSLGVAYMMMDYARVLGRRRPRVHIWQDEGGRKCLLWDLVPMGGRG